MATIKATDANFASEVLGSPEPVLVDFWAEWCAPCKQMNPSLEELSAELAGRVRIAKVNVDENPQITSQFGIRSCPTLLVFKGGQPVAQKVGAAPKGQLAKWLQDSI